MTILHDDKSSIVVMRLDKITLWEEEPRDPEGLWWPDLDPAVNEPTAQNKVLDPTAQRLHRWVGCTRPKLWHKVVEEGVVNHFQFFTHHNKSFDGTLQLPQ